MPNHKNQHQLQSIEEESEHQQISQQHLFKIPATTRLTQLLNNFALSDSFVLGKNDLLENNTSSELDSSDNESDVSFQERLNCQHEKHMVREIIKFFQFKGAIHETNSFQSKSSSKSTQLMKDIEERVFEEVKRSHGNNEVQKIKLALKFIKRNENLTKIYFEVVKSVPSNLQTTVFVLFKHSVIVYLQGRQYIGGQQNNMSESMIKGYLGKNSQKFCQQLMKDEKLLLLYNHKHDQMMKKKFQGFIFQWMQGFFMAKEGFPCSELINVQKNPNSKVGIRQGTMESEKRKKIKKF